MVVLVDGGEDIKDDVVVFMMMDGWMDGDGKLPGSWVVVKGEVLWS